jgi:hypothetical protein
MLKIFNLSNFFDYLGIASSGLCFIHCILPPLLLIFNISIAETPGFNYLFLFISFIAVFNATKHHSKSSLVIWLWLAFALTSMGILFEEDFPHLEYLVYTSSFALIGGHIWNIKHCQTCKVKESDNQ